MRFTVLIGMFALAACQQTETQSNVPEESAASSPTVELDAEDYTNRLAEAGLPITDIVVVTEETDDNQMLGRPGQYTSKTYFIDERHRGQGFQPEEQNTVEVFSTVEDATRRREYVEGVIAEMPMFNQYIIQSGTAVMRLDKAITPSQAREYETALGS